MVLTEDLLEQEFRRTRMFGGVLPPEAAVFWQCDSYVRQLGLNMSNACSDVEIQFLDYKVEQLTQTTPTETFYELEGYKLDEEAYLNKLLEGLPTHYQEYFLWLRNLRTQQRHLDELNERRILFQERKEGAMGMRKRKRDAKSA